MNIDTETPTFESEFKNDGIFEIIVGTYEEYVVGYTFHDRSMTLKESFHSHSHRGSVRCVATNGRFAASGGIDEQIQVYDLSLRKGVGTFLNHSGTITSLRFTPEGHHLMSAGQDGTICIFRLGSWILEKQWSSAHKGSGVLCVTIHPSSKLALSLGENKSLKTWNLIKGRPSYTTNLSSFGKFVDLVVWSTKGTYFAVAVDVNVYIFSTETAGVVLTVDCPKRITCLAFIKDKILCIGDQFGSIICYNIKNNSALWEKKVSDVRIKCLSCVKSEWLIAACSDGQINVWNISEIKSEPENPTIVNIGCRITCMDIRLIENMT